MDILSPEREVGQSLVRRVTAERQRKVRAPQGEMVDNVDRPKG